MRFATITSILIIAAVLMATQIGCAIRPDFSPPGPVNLQRHRAVVHDPFPSNTMGPPIEGARPMEYARPLSEPDGMQTNPYAQRRRGY